MLFHTFEFALFLPIVFALYWFVFQKRLFLQNLFIVGASFLFYGWWDPRFLILILISIGTDYGIGLWLGREERPEKRKRILWFSIAVNIGILGIFKYFGFFVESLTTALSLFNIELSLPTLTIILPVGISFYTFQTLSYTIDVYRKKIEPTRDWVAFAAFVSFFPQLVAGPIERATNLLPQFQNKRTFEYGKAVDGMRQILWGLFLKVVIADRCAPFVDSIFEKSTLYPGSTLLLGTFLFAFQIYGDFAGYSHIAIGTSRLFGISLMQNFATPYFSRDIAEFWRRWHISLSTWFRDYLYIPLGGSREGRRKTVRNTFIIFLVSGLWHGAEWSFLFWGLIHALCFLPLVLQQKNRRHLGVVAENSRLPSLRELRAMVTTFLLTSLAWIFFRADNLSQGFAIVKKIFSDTLFYRPNVIDRPEFFPLMGFLTFAVLMEWIGRRDRFALEKSLSRWKSLPRYLFYLALATVILYHSGSDQPFIYFQF